jgi:SAM-dependent methyltransferase
MQKRGYAVEGTEWTAASVARVPAASGIRVHVGDLLDLGLPARTYDAVTLWHVLEHLRRPDAALERIAVLLRPGGWLVLAIPNADGAQARRYGPAWFHHDPPRHLVGLGQAALEPLLAAQGFRIVHLRTSSLEQDLFGEIQSRLNARGFPRDRLYQHLKGLARAPLPTRVGDFARLVLSTPPALARVLADGLRGAGATLTVEARLDPR